MRYVFILLMIFGMSVYGKEVVVTTSKNSISVLQNSKIYIDDERQRLQDILNHAEFKEFSKDYINLSITDNTLYVLFTLVNTSPEPIKKLLVMNNPFLLKLSLFELSQNGLKEIQYKRKTLSPSIPLMLEADQSKTYCMKIYGNSAIKFGLSLEDKKTFLDNDRINQIVNVVLLATVVTLMFYTLTLYFMIWDSTYFFYSMYLFGVLYLEVSYIGLSAVYFPSWYTDIDIHTLIIKITYVVIFYSLFFNSFLKLRELKLFYYGNMFAMIMAIAMVFFTYIPYDVRAKIDLLVGIFFLTFNFFAAIVKYKSGFKEARLFIWGIGIVIFTYILMILEALGIFSVVYYVPNILIYATAIEAMILSLAFVDRYLILQKQKEQSDYRLLLEARNREQLIQKEVDQKTDALQKALGLQEVLYKELHHRVKNNLQLILSITRLQKEQLIDNTCKSSFSTLESRIGAISQTHNLIYLSKDMEHVNMLDYVTRLTQGLKAGDIDDDVTFHYDIAITMPLDKAVTIGLIINELISKALKYAFEKEGEVTIILKEGYLEIRDNGVGFQKEDISKESLGLQLVESLVRSQLKGTIDCIHDNGTVYVIKFNETRKG
jgi:two-component sensor histidine kinase